MSSSSSMSVAASHAAIWRHDPAALSSRLTPRPVPTERAPTPASHDAASSRPPGPPPRSPRRSAGDSDRRLPETPEIGLDDRADLRVSPRGLRIAQLHDGLPAMRHLDHAWHDPVGAQLHGFHRHEGRPREPEAVAVALGRDLPGLSPEASRETAVKPSYSAAGRPARPACRRARGAARGRAGRG